MTEPRRFELLALDTLHEPVLVARTEMDDDALDSLVTSIRELGVQEPLIVTPREAGGYEVVAGHRRLLASRIARLAKLPCMIEFDQDKLRAIKLHENVEREELNPADEAVFFAELYEELENDVDQVCAAVRKGRDYVEGRLLLLQGSPEVLEALRQGKVKLGVARQINLMEEPSDRNYYLEYAVTGGASVRQATQWRVDANTRLALERARQQRESGDGKPPPPELAAEPTGPNYSSMSRPNELTGSTEPVRCLFCDTEHEAWRCYRKYVCEPCANEYLVKMEQRRAMERT